MLFGIGGFATTPFAMTGGGTMVDVIRQPWSEICRKKNAWVNSPRAVTGITRC